MQVTASKLRSREKETHPKLWLKDVWYWLRGTLASSRSRQESSSRAEAVDVSMRLERWNRLSKATSFEILALGTVQITSRVEMSSNAMGLCQL